MNNIDLTIKTMEPYVDYEQKRISTINSFKNILSDSNIIKKNLTDNFIRDIDKYKVNVIFVVPQVSRPEMNLEHISNEINRRNVDMSILEFVTSSAVGYLKGSWLRLRALLAQPDLINQPYIVINIMHKEELLGGNSKRRKSKLRKSKRRKSKRGKSKKKKKTRRRSR